MRRYIVEIAILIYLRRYIIIQMSPDERDKKSRPPGAYPGNLSRRERT